MSIVLPFLINDKLAYFIPHNGKSRLPPCHRLSYRPMLQMQELVAAFYGIHPQLMTGQSRDQAHVWPRWVAMHLIRKLMGKSLPGIGKAFGHRHHTSVLHGLRKVEKRMEGDSEFRNAIDQLTKVLKA